jgi:hypothetical protein
VTNNLPSQEPVLSVEDLEHFETQGYVKVAGAVPAEQVAAAAEAIWQFLGMDPNDPDDWYRPPHSPDGIVNIHQHQALWDNRQSPRIYRAFCQLWKTEKLWVSLDRASMKPPVNPKYPGWKWPPFLHWDVDLKETPIKFGIQGVLCLSDTTVDQGGFHCIPGTHRETIEWSRMPLEQRDINAPPPFDSRKVHSIEARAGDFIIWHRALPHGSGVNNTNRPRLAQYILCTPAGYEIAEQHSTEDPKAEMYEILRRQRIAQWERRIGPANLCLDPREAGAPAYLTPLGRKLLGLDLWE